MSARRARGVAAGHQCVLVETAEGMIVIGDDVTHSMAELVVGREPNLDRIHALGPWRVYLSHAAEPWEPEW